MLKNYFKNPLYTLTHPVDGFYTMKHGQGKVSLIFVNLFLFCISYSFQKQYAGFVINENNPLSYNSLMDLFTICLVFALWCVGNWSITTLTNGEGKFKEIAMAASYSLTPMIITFIPATLISNLFTEAEKEFYFILIGIAIFWFIVLLFVGTMSVHNFTVGKTVQTIFLTFISIMIILFIMLLIGSLISQVWNFFRSIYTEIIYRI